MSSAARAAFEHLVMSNVSSSISDLATYAVLSTLILLQLLPLVGRKMELGWGSWGG